MDDDCPAARHRRQRRRLAARRAGAPAAAVAAGYPRRAARARRRTSTSPALATNWRPRNASNSPSKSCSCSSDPHFSELYGPGSRAEVPIVGRLILGGETRARVRPDRSPGGHASVCADCRFQNESPGRRAESRTCRRLTCASSRSTAPCSLSCTRTSRVRAALIWTEVPDLMELSAEMLDAALVRITSAR